MPTADADRQHREQLAQQRRGVSWARRQWAEAAIRRETADRQPKMGVSARK